MKSVKRYDGKIGHCDNGGYVTFADYKKLEARLENAEGRERKHCKRADTAEAELARRDAQEPLEHNLVHSSVLPTFVGDTDEVQSYCCMVHGQTPQRKTQAEAYADAKLLCGTLYAEPRPAVLQEWSDAQCLEFISIAFRHAEISGDIEMDDIRLGIKMVNAGGEVAE